MTRDEFLSLWAAEQANGPTSSVRVADIATLRTRRGEG